MRYRVKDLPPYQSDPKVVESLLNEGARKGYHLEWVIPVGGRAMRWAGVFVRRGPNMYEYKVIQFPPYASDVREVERQLNKMHEDRWELIDVLVMGRRGSHVVGIFRRGIANEQSTGQEAKQGTQKQPAAKRAAPKG